MKRKIATALLTLGAVALAACGPDFDRVEIAKQPSKIGGDISTTTLQIPVGMIVKAHLAPIDDSGDTMTASVRSADNTIVEAANVVTDADFAFIGLRPGRTEIELKADNKIVLIIPAVVTEQGVSPDTTAF
jgi:hypothetical protein